MINNRQGGRRRGRGGQRNPNMGGRPDGNNRQDNRQRGNAAQLLEKYKNLARDAQLSGDRVQTEYYLQFADHYFRVLGESRSRFEEQRRPRDDEFDDEDEGDEMETAEGGSDEDQADEAPRYERGNNRDRQRGQRNARDDRNGEDRGNRDETAAEHAERPQRAERPERAERAERGEQRPRRNGSLSIGGNGGNGAEAAAGISLEVLPPAIGAVETANDEDAEAKPRRRTRRPRVAGNEDEIAPAA